MAKKIKLEAMEISPQVWEEFGNLIAGMAKTIAEVHEAVYKRPSHEALIETMKKNIESQEIVINCLRNSKLIDLIEYCKQNMERVNSMTLELKGVIAQARALFQEGKAFQRINDLPKVSETLNDLLSKTRKELPRLYHKIDKMGRLMKEFDECLDLLPNPCEQAYPDNQALAQASDALRAAQKSPEKPRAK